MNKIPNTKNYQMSKDDLQIQLTSPIERNAQSPWDLLGFQVYVFAEDCEVMKLWLTEPVS